MKKNMLKDRICETQCGIQGDINVHMYDKMQCRLKNKGWIDTDNIIKAGINKGIALEIGPGPGYLGLEWLKKTSNTRLKAIEISNDMIKIAEKNAKKYELSNRVSYIQGDSQSLPFEDHTFDAVFSNGSLHEWVNPDNIFNEIFRVLKKEGTLFISDLKRDLSFFARWFLHLAAKPKEMRPGLITSLNAAYTQKEVEMILKKTNFINFSVKSNPIGVSIICVK